jgi:uncharacterized protein YfaT (DUF1175 family)
MLAHLKQRRIGFTVAAGFALVFAVSYFSLGRTAGTGLIPSSLKTQPTTPQSKPGSAPRNLSQPSMIDEDHDGLPDTAELSTFMDRENFRRWFTGIAESQFYHLNNNWNVAQRDCAGLVRFAFREALKRHDHAWYQKMGAEFQEIAADVSDRSPERNPLGDKLFRVENGSYRQNDLEGGKFSEFADARTLKTFNCNFISRNRQQAQAGDLLFFYQPWVQKFPFHVMIFLGEARIAGDGNTDWVVYHTGSSPTDQGMVKKVRLAVLDHHPDKRWRPVESNRNFLGFYRLKILE